jgi:hypothetical protein
MGADGTEQFRPELLQCARAWGPPSLPARHGRDQERFGGRTLSSAQVIRRQPGERDTSRKPREDSRRRSQHQAEKHACRRVIAAQGTQQRIGQHAFRAARLGERQLLFEKRELVRDRRIALRQRSERRARPS